jgi:NADPH-dependent F420 reductase
MVMTETTDLQRGKELKDLTIGIIGGTGAQGTGLGYRFARSGFKVILGSRDGAKAVATAAEVGHGIAGASNFECAEKSDLVIVAVPWDSHKETLTSLKNELTGKVVIDCVNPMGFDAGGAFPLLVEEGSASAQAQGILNESHVVTAFNHVSAVLLSDQSLAEIEIDIMVVGDHKPATDLVQQLVDQIAGMRGIYAGKMRNAGQVEALTANLISMNRRYKTHTGVRIIGIN